MYYGIPSSMDKQRYAVTRDSKLKFAWIAFHERSKRTAPEVASNGPLRVVMCAEHLSSGLVAWFEFALAGLTQRDLSE